MRIADLRIRNFRGIRVGHIRFDRHTVLSGPNNCGKTTVIEALALLFGRDRMLRALTEHDFYGGDPQPTDRIQLVATIVDFEGDEPAEHAEWFREDRGIIKWWDPDTGATSATRDQATWRLACQLGFCARFDRPSLDVETIRYFHDDDSVLDVFLEDVATPVPNRLIRDIGFFLVPAGRTWDRVVSFGSELFRRVVASGDGQPAESVLAERDRLRVPMQPLEADQRLQPIIASLNAELSGFFRSGPTLHLRVTATDSDGLLDAVVPHYRQAGAGTNLPARRHGTGLISLQHLLLLFQFGRRRAADGEGFWMALEEPELHVPPPLQRRLVHRIQALSTQTFVSTHSPLVAAMADPQSLIMLRNDNGTLTSTALLKGLLPSDTPNGIRKLFQGNRAETISALMYEIVLVPEGRIDYEWLRLLTRAVDLHQGWRADAECRLGCYVGVVPTHDAAVEMTVATLSRLHPNVTALVDGDAAGLHYTQMLAASAAPPALTLRWPDGWTIEDVVGWLLDADAASAIAALANAVAPAPQSVAALVTRLKSEDRGTHGLKQDHVAYEGIADAIGSTDACCDRARELLNALADTLLGAENNRFTITAGQNPQVRVFRP